jgi:hypothetical protein
MIDIDTPVYFTAPDGKRYRVTVGYDQDMDSPRTWTNGSVIHTFDNDYNSPDGKVCDDRRHRQIHPLIPGDYVEGRWVDMRRATRWVNLFGPAENVLAIVGIDRGHDGTLSIDAGGVEETSGYAVVTTETWEDTQGKAVPFDREIALSMIRGEVEVYNKWAQGEFTMVEVAEQVEWKRTDSDETMMTWCITESVGGFDDEDAAFEQGVEFLPEGSDRED